MTRIINGYAQPDIVATKGDEKVMVFVEIPKSLRNNAKAIQKTLEYINATEPNTRVDLVQTKPRG